jgi:hypothetical protein
MNSAAASATKDGDSPTTGHLRRRLQCHRETLPLPRQQHHPNLVDPQTGNNQLLTNGQDTWSARCGESPHAGCSRGRGRAGDTGGHRHRARRSISRTTAQRTFVTSPDDLKATAIYALRRLQKLPARLVRGFFADPCLRYITA